jgi:23S rRNA U2552 (ribose-2'-O)-methylase RlmE/FtsJ
MNNVLETKPPWTTIQWIQSPPWQEIPNITYSAWVSVHDTEALKVKQMIGDLDKEQKWELTKKLVNPYELVYTHNDERLPPSRILNVQPLSRSFFKMIEILDVMDFFKEPFSKLKTAHVAEGPGGFIQAIYHVAEEKKRTLLKSYAMTLKPTTPHVPGWKKASAFLTKYKQVTINYGADGTGDIYNEANQASFIETCGQGSVHIFTADGGFDFSIDYSSQEEKVFHLLVCSSLIGLQVLQKDGYFILKLFDINSQSTQFLVFLLARCFSYWALYKPAMTRVCNSERYFLGKRLRSFPSKIRMLLQQMKQQSEINQFPHYAIPSVEFDFLNQYNQITTYQQIQYIQRAIYLHNHPEEWWTKYLKKHIKLSTSWCEHFRILSIPLIQYLKLVTYRFPSLCDHTFHTTFFQQ